MFTGVNETLAELRNKCNISVAEKCLRSLFAKPRSKFGNANNIPFEIGFIDSRLETHMNDGHIIEGMKLKEMGSIVSLMQNAILWQLTFSGLYSNNQDAEDFRHIVQKYPLLQERLGQQLKFYYLSGCTTCNHCKEKKISLNEANVDYAVDMQGFHFMGPGKFGFACKECCTTDENKKRMKRKLGILNAKHKKVPPICFSL